jgi:hypothetical protein
MGRDRDVFALCAAAGANITALGVTARGRPRHPLYLAAGTRPQPWSYQGLPSLR